MADEKQYTDDEIRSCMKNCIKAVLAHPERAVAILNALMEEADCPVMVNPHWKSLDGWKPKEESCRQTRMLFGDS